MSIVSSTQVERRGARAVAAAGFDVWAERLLLGAVVVMGLFLATYRLDRFPLPWFDEGWWLQIPRNLVEYGQYATYSVEGFRPFDTVVSASPLFFLPVAAMFKVAGVGLFQARLVVVLHFVVAGAFLYLIGRRLFGRWPALLGLVLYILIRGDGDGSSALYLGRHVMGEIPGMAYFLAGGYAWLRYFDKRQARWLVISGLLLGIGMGVKPQLIMATPAAMILAAAIDIFWWRRRRFAAFIVPLVFSGVALVLQYVSLYFLLGPDNFARFLADFSAASGPQVRVFLQPEAVSSAIKLLIRGSYFVWLLPALAYGLAQLMRRSGDQIGRAYFLAFALVWFGWFVFASVGWERYVIPGLIVGHLFVAHFMTELAGPVRASFAQWRTSWRDDGLAGLLRPIAVGAIVAMLLVHSSSKLVGEILTAPETDARYFAETIDATVEPGARIETWEWEIVFLSKHQAYHLPPTSLLNDLIAFKNLGASYDPASYDYQQFDPDYVLVGPFADSTGLYAASLDGAEVVAQRGPYRLFRLPSR